MERGREARPPLSQDQLQQVGRRTRHGMAKGLAQLNVLRLGVTPAALQSQR